MVILGLEKTGEERMTFEGIMTLQTKEEEKIGKKERRWEKEEVRKGKKRKRRKGREKERRWKQGNQRGGKEDLKD